MNTEKILEESAGQVEEEILRFFGRETVSHQQLIEAMKYSLMAGGKRIRPALCFAFCEAAGGEKKDALAFGAALEMLHTYSLIHDDLPCMDNDDFRRGKPTNHKVYGEATAMLAGDALQTAAFEEVLSAPVDAEKKVLAGEILAKAAGRNGMCGGQLLDMDTPHRKLSIAELEDIHEKKTAALLEAACMMGVAAAGGSQAQMDAAKAYAASIGLAFQVRDDMLDVIANEEKLGKPVGSDAKNQKSTFVTELGLARCQEIVEKETESAKQALKTAFTETRFLSDFADWLAQRDY